MTDTRSIAADALFMIVYVGFAAAMACLTVLLVLFLVLELPFSAIHVAAAFANLAGWMLLPFFPELYRRIVGQRFSWRSNSVLTGGAEA